MGRPRKNPIEDTTKTKVKESEKENRNKDNTLDIDNNKTGRIMMCSYRDCPIEGCKRFHLNRNLNELYLVENFKPDKDGKCEFYL